MSEIPNEPEALAAVKTLEAISKKLHPGALSGAAYNAVFSALRAAYADVSLATDTIQKVNAWIAEAKPLLERGGKAETALAAADSDRESLRACVVRLAACMERIIELHRLEYLVGQEDGGRVAHAMRDAKKELTALREAVKGDAK